MNDETLDIPEVKPTEKEERKVSRLEQELMKINNDPTLSPENKQVRMKQAWAENRRRVFYIKKSGPKFSETTKTSARSKGEALGQNFFKATGKKWEDATPEERKAFMFPEGAHFVETKGVKVFGVDTASPDVVEGGYISGSAHTDLSGNVSPEPRELE